MAKKFKDSEIFDLIEIYQNTYLEEVPSLKIICEKIFEKKFANINNAFSRK